MSDLVTDRYVQCTNIDCGHQYVVQIGVLRTIVPSLAPDPKINIPMVERRANDITVTRADQATTITETAAPVPAHGRGAPSALSAH